MRYKWNKKKNEKLLKERGAGFGVVVELFDHPYHLSQKNDDPEQWRAIGWAQGKLMTLIFEEREDEAGPYYWLVTFWSSTKTERGLYHKN